jgi:pimeloyl-ACP methyl ester carboxylesterase
MLTSLRLCLPLLMLTMLVAAGAAAAPACGIADFPNYQLQYCRYPGKEPGPVLVLEAGMGRGMHSWPPQFLERLNAYSEVLVYNRIGYGKSRLHRRHLRQPVMARDSSRRLQQLLRRLYRDKPAVLVAHSLGGLYAQYFARAYAAQTAALVLLDAASAFEPQADNPFAGREPSRQRSLAYLEWKGAQLSQAQLRHMRALPDIPVLVIAATEHHSPARIEALWQQVQTQLATDAPRGRLVVAAGSGHDVFRDAPELVAREIARLVQDEGLH